jgi:hypothetical protein
VPREIPELDEEDSVSDYEGGGGGSLRRQNAANGNLESAQSENSVDLSNDLAGDMMMGAAHPIN